MKFPIKVKVPSTNGVVNSDTVFEWHRVALDQPSSPSPHVTLAGIIRSKPKANNDIEIEIQYWNPVDQTNVDDLEDYPTGLFSRLAQRKLERLDGVTEPAAPAMLTVRSNVNGDSLYSGSRRENPQAS